MEERGWNLTVRVVQLERVVALGGRHPGTRNFGLERLDPPVESLELDLH
jgi:hypothetical protein